MDLRSNLLWYFLARVEKYLCIASLHSGLQIFSTVKILVKMPQKVCNLVQFSSILGRILLKSGLNLIDFVLC